MAQKEENARELPKGDKGVKMQTFEEALKEFKERYMDHQELNDSEMAECFKGAKWAKDWIIHNPKTEGLIDLHEVKSELSGVDQQLRDMQATGQITMKQMIVALKPVMWLTENLLREGEKKPYKDLEPVKKTYVVEVHNAQGSASYVTEVPDVTQNYIRGNEPMIRFVTVEGYIVNLPNNVIITQRESK